jgi:hypothetical protein
MSNDRRNFVFFTVELHDGSHRVLEQLEEHVVEMRRHVNHLDWCTLQKNWKNDTTMKI